MYSDMVSGRPAVSSGRASHCLSLSVHTTMDGYTCCTSVHSGLSATIMVDQGGDRMSDELLIIIGIVGLLLSFGLRVLLMVRRKR